MDIRQTLAALAAGDLSRFDEFMSRFETTVTRTIAASIRDRSAQDDVLQETWSRAFEQIGRLEDAQAVEAWLARIARNCATDHLRRQARSRELERRCDSRKDDADASWIWDLVESLDPAANEVLAWRYRFGLSYAEIASRLQLPVSTVRGRLYQARLELRRLLEEGEPR